MCPGMRPATGMDGVFDLDARTLELVGHFAQGVLGLRHCHAVARHDDHFARVLHAGTPRPRRSRVLTGCCSAPAAGPAVSPPNPPRMTATNERFMPLHMI